MPEKLRWTLPPAGATDGSSSSIENLLGDLRQIESPVRRVSFIHTLKAVLEQELEIISADNPDPMADEGGTGSKS